MSGTIPHSSHLTMHTDSCTTCEVSNAVQTPAAARSGRGRKYIRQSAYWLTLGGLFLLSAEMTARLDDWAHLGIPIFSTPDQERDLFLKDENGTRGRPHGRFKKWQMNQFGFRGPEITLEPVPGCTRVLILGASETFGLYESDGKEFPAQLEDRLNHNGRYEVINAALPGMTIRSMRKYWENWASQFRPDIVVIYPSPLFYLGDAISDKQPPKIPRTEPVPEKAIGFRSRLVFRMKDVFHVPEFISKWRTERQIDALISDKDDDWFIREMPKDRLALFAKDVEKLMQAIENKGARPVLVTHAVRVAMPPRAEDFDDLHGMRIHLPRASEEVLASFEYEAARVITAEGAKRHVQVIAVAEAMNGRRNYFADLVHFTDEGAARVAELMAEGILSKNTTSLLDQAASRHRD